MCFGGSGPQTQLVNTPSYSADNAYTAVKKEVTPGTASPSASTGLQQMTSPDGGVKPLDPAQTGLKL